MILILIDTKTGSQRTIMVPVTKREATSPATVLTHPRFARVAGSHGGELAESASRSLEAFTQLGSVLARGAQDLTREWVQLTQDRFSKNVEGMTALAGCRSLPEFFVVQTKLVQENVQQVIEGARRIVERSMQLAGEATQNITAQGTKTRTGRSGPAA